MATGRPNIIYCTNAFHGMTNGALSLNGNEMFRRGFAPLLPDCVKVPFNDLPPLEAALKGGQVAAFIVEPIQGKGVHLPYEAYLAAPARLGKRQRALFISQENHNSAAHPRTLL